MSDALAEVLAAITCRPIGHWRAEIASPAFAGIARVAPRGVQWRVKVDPYRSTTQTRRAPLRQTEPAREIRHVGNTLVAVEVSPAHTITPAEAVEALHACGLWPWLPGDESAPAWWCERCGGTRLVRTHNFESDWCDACDRDDNEPTGHTSAPPSHAALGVLRGEASRREATLAARASFALAN